MIIKFWVQIFAKRLKATLAHIIDEIQTGFMTQRHISNNIRLVLDLIDYADLCKDNSLILFIDFYKAFDSTEHVFIFQALEEFKTFGITFVILCNYSVMLDPHFFTSKMKPNCTFSPLNLQNNKTAVKTVDFALKIIFL